MAEEFSNVWFDTNPNLLPSNEIQLPKRQNIFSASRREKPPSAQTPGNQNHPLQKIEKSAPKKIFKLFLVTNEFPHFVTSGRSGGPARQFQPIRLFHRWMK
jgi:hypothetical protein